MGLPVMIEVENKPVLVVGGGNVALRKITSLLEQGALVTCIAPKCQPRLLDKQKGLTVIGRHFEPGDIRDYFMVIGATDDPKVNDRIYQLAQTRHILAMTVDQSGQRDFSFMAKRCFDDLTIAVATAGQAPGFVRKLIAKMAAVITPADLEALKIYIVNRKKQ